MSTHFVLVLKIERITNRAEPSSRRSSTGVVTERKLSSEMTSITLRSSTYEGILMKAEKMLQLERDLGADVNVKGEVADDDEDYG